MTGTNATSTTATSAATDVQTEGDSIPFAFFKPPGGGHNVGDYLGRYIVERLSGRKTRDPDPARDPEILLTAGSIINKRLPDNCTFWGSGLLRSDDAPNPANRFLAVRGPLTQARLRACGVEPPRALGDPALLMPLIYQPKPAAKRYRLGVIPHYADLQSFLVRARRSILAHKDDCVVLKTATDRVEAFIDVVTSCELVVSSSLHGVILAQAYGVPALWVQFSGDVIGDGFKFKDYFLSVAVDPFDGPRLEKDELQLEQLMALTKGREQQMSINNFDPLPLIWACPFITADTRQRLIRQVSLEDSGLGWRQAFRSDGAQVRQIELAAENTIHDRIRLVNERRTDLNRWALPKSFPSAWAPRSAMAAQWVPPGSRLLDIGCGAMFLERYLPASVTYWPADLVQRDERTLICDVNRGVLPSQCEVADVITFLGVLEYVFDVWALLQRIWRPGLRLILTYCDRESSNFGRSDRREHGWVNDYSTSELEQVMKGAGFSVERRQRVDDAQWMYEVLATPRPEPDENTWDKVKS